MNLFWSTRSLANAREDHLTEFFAASLVMSETFRCRYTELVLADFLNKNSSSEAFIKDVTTQVSFEGTTCRPDMLLQLSNGQRIICEHKLEALETVGPVEDERGQLERYLDLPVEGVVYVRSSWKPPSNIVLKHPKYIRAPNRELFLWRDFYPLFKSENSIFFQWIKDSFERLGFTPPHPSIGEMSGPDDEKNRINRKNFAKLWSSLKSFAHQLGWTVESGSIVGLYLGNNPNSLASMIFISPAKAQRFLLRITPGHDLFTKAKDSIFNASGETFTPHNIDENEVARKQGKIKVFDITTSLFDLLGGNEITPEEAEKKLLEFVSPFLVSLQKTNYK